MQGLERLTTLLDRFGTYPLWAVAIELAVIWLVVFGVVRFVQGTRAAGAIRALVLIIVIATVAVALLGGDETLGRLGYLYERGLAVFALALVVIFQPELRRALIRLGERPMLARAGRDTAGVVAALVDSCGYLARANFGALIVIERSVGLRGLVEGGTELDARVSSRLIQTVFFPGSALHDLALVIKGDRARAAGVQLPLASQEDMPDASLGSRHRAAVGLTAETDALVVVVSEETGLIRIAERGRLSRPFDKDDFEEQLTRRLGAPAAAVEPAAADAGRDPADDDADDDTVVGGMSDEPLDGGSDPDTDGSRAQEGGSRGTV